MYCINVLDKKITEKEITLLFENILNDIQKLYVEQDGGFLIL